MQELQHSKFFEGPDSKKIFAHSLNLLEQEHYKIVGRLVALSLTQDGPGVHFMSRHMYDIMVGLKPDLNGVSDILSDILSTDVQDCLKQVIIMHEQ